MSVGIGEALREARTRAGVTIADAAAETRIRETYLHALEDERFGIIGGDVYVRGFLRSYARFLGLDPQPLLDAYRDDYAPTDEQPSFSQEPVAAPPQARRPMAVIVVAVVLLLLGGLVVIGYLTPDEDTATDLAMPEPVEDDDDETDDVEPDEDDQDDDEDLEDDGEEDEDEDLEDDEEDEEDEEEAENDEDDNGEPTPTEEIILTFSVSDGESWVRVTVDGEEVEQGIFGNGTSETYRGDEVVLRIGNPGPTNLDLNGDDLGQVAPPGQPVDVRCTTEAGDCEVSA